MARKNKISASYSPEYTLIGIACHLKDYRMAFLLNDRLGTSFRRIDDLVFPGAETEKSYSIFHDPHKDERVTYFLIQNHHPDGRLVPSQKGVDFFIAINDVLDPGRVRSICMTIQSIPKVITAFSIDLDKIKNADVLFEELELQLLEQRKGKGKKGL